MARTPLAMGLLTGKYAPGKNVPPDGDARRDTPHWDYFDDATMEGWTKKVTAIRAALTEDGRTLAQGALDWIWSYSAVTIPTPASRALPRSSRTPAPCVSGRSPRRRWPPSTWRWGASLGPPRRRPKHIGLARDGVRLVGQPGGSHRAICNAKAY